MTTITDPGIEAYMMSLSAEEDPVMAEMEEQARQMKFPIVDRLVGRFLCLITKLKKPKLVVELGSGFGYSALWFARGLEAGTVVLTDYDGQKIAHARSIFGRCGLSGKACFRTGGALEIASEYCDIDILFIDLDKHDYPRSVNALLPNLSPDALVIADNALWYGRVLDGQADRDTQAIKEFNRLMFSHPQFFSVIVPLRDGVLLGQRRPRDVTGNGA